MFRQFGFRFRSKIYLDTQNFSQAIETNAKQATNRNLKKIGKN